MHEGWFSWTQGNEFLIPTPPLPPCAPAICEVEPVPGPKKIGTNLPAQGTPGKSEMARIAQGPAIELSDQQLTVIRWTTINLSGSPVHYGVVHYGTDPKDLRYTASSPIRLDPSHATAVFRVRLAGLNPETTYYYRVDSMEANGNGDGLKCSIKQFATR